MKELKLWYQCVRCGDAHMTGDIMTLWKTGQPVCFNCVQYHESVFNGDPDTFRECTRRTPPENGGEKERGE